MTENEKLDLVLDKITTLDEKVDTLDKKVDMLDKSVATLSGDVGMLDKSVVTLSGDVDALGKRVVTLSGEVTALDRRVETLDKKVTRMESDVIYIKLTIENEIRVNIQRVAEGHLDLSRNLNECIKLSNDVKDRQEIQDIYINMHHNKLKALEA